MTTDKLSHVEEGRTDMRQFKIVKSGTGYAVAEVMDCGGKGMGPDRNWRFVGPGCTTIERAETLLAFWNARA